MSMMRLPRLMAMPTEANPTMTYLKRKKESVVMQRLPYPTETVLSNKITRNRTVLSFKDSPRKPLRR